MDKNKNNIVSQYVASVNTTERGVIIVTARNIAKKDVDTYSLQLVPYTDAEGTVKATAADFVAGTAKPIKAWKCGPATTKGIAIKYLPSSCRSVEAG